MATKTCNVFQGCKTARIFSINIEWNFRAPKHYLGRTNESYTLGACNEHLHLMPDKFRQLSEGFIGVAEQVEGIIKELVKT